MRKNRRFAKVVREFNDRGAQWLLESPENLRGLLLTTSRQFAERMDFSRAEQIRTRSIPDNLRKQEADLLFRIPYLPEGQSAGGEVFVYVLLEHQSKTDPSMGFRLLFYMVNIWDMQRREWVAEDIPVSKWRFLPIIPMVFYTGEQRWAQPISMKTLMELPRELEQFIPVFETLLLKLKESSPEELTASGHPFGWLLRVMRNEHASEEELTRELNHAMEHLSGLAEEDLVAWEKAIYFLYLLIHHRRGVQEGERIIEKIDDKVEVQRGRKVRSMMEQTLAEYLVDKGRDEGRDEGMRKGLLKAKQDDLLGLMAEKFGAVPDSTTQRVRAMEDTETLDRLLRQFVHAESLPEMGI